MRYAKPGEILNRRVYPLAFYSAVRRLPTFPSAHVPKVITAETAIAVQDGYIYENIERDGYRVVAISHERNVKIDGSCLIGKIKILARKLKETVDCLKINIIRFVRIRAGDIERRDRRFAAISHEKVSGWQAGR
ncbi:hypothetical protein PUN28_019277 [Cardiocondyla obscurior]|uniref:Uncharacterized protein n=1 Tax=Cardiocondyla obscurior TaxID=286306 RepID=A0AAW2EEQ8_9HYME